MARSFTRYAGELVAAVLAEFRDLAEDLADRVSVDAQPLSATEAASGVPLTARRTPVDHPGMRKRIGKRAGLASASINTLASDSG